MMREWVTKQDINLRWCSYFHKYINEGHDCSLNFIDLILEERIKFNPITEKSKNLM